MNEAHGGCQQHDFMLLQNMNCVVPEEYTAPGPRVVTWAFPAGGSIRPGSLESHKRSAKPDISRPSGHVDGAHAANGAFAAAAGTPAGK
jgi:hypothetical protein